MDNDCVLTTKRGEHILSILLIVKMGATFPSLAKRRGDFDNWIFKGILEFIAFGGFGSCGLDRVHKKNTFE